MEIEDQDQDYYYSLCDGLEDYPDSDEDNSLYGPLSKSFSSETSIVGFIMANIVEVEYHGYIINNQVKVGLKREPRNLYDKNAIKVLISGTVEVGVIDSSLAAVLSPMMKSKLISLDGIVRNSCPAENQNKIPCQIRIFARFEAFPTVKAEISKGGFQLMGSVITKSEKEMKSVDEIFKIIGENVSKTLALKLMDAPKTVIKSDLFVHQKEGLGWLFHRENTGELPPFWEEKEDGSYVNLLSKLHTIERPEPLRGGFFADDTGMGKTLTLLSLIACDRYSASSSSTDSGSLDVHKLREISDQGEGFTILGCKRGRVGEMDPAATKKLEASSNKVNTVCVDDKSVTDMGTKRTLVLCHPSVVETWEEHLEEHTVPDKLKVYKYYGNRTRDPEELRKYDIVLTTYSTLGSEARWLSSPLKLLVWWRIILDDAHIIKYLDDQQRQCVINLNSKRRWVVTGGTVQNSPNDLFTLMAFLRFYPFSIRSFWQNLIQKPLEQGDQKGLLHYQVLTKTIGL